MTSGTHCHQNEVAQYFVREPGLALCHEEEENLLWVKGVKPGTIEHADAAKVLRSKVGEIKMLVDSNKLAFSETGKVIAFLVRPAGKLDMLSWQT